MYCKNAFNKVKVAYNNVYSKVMGVKCGSSKSLSGMDNLDSFIVTFMKGCVQF